MSARLSREFLLAYIEDKELPARSGEPLAAAAEKIIRYGAFVGSVIERHGSLNRTMLYARERIEHCERAAVPVANGTVILADTLSESKGRFTREWHAPRGGLWGSLIYVSTLLPRYRMLVPLAVGVACCEAVREFGARDAMIRWINDVLIDGYKVGGFLAESFTGHFSGEEYCLLGFGINVNNGVFPEELAATATSLTEHLGRRVAVDEFACCFLAKLWWNLGLLYYQEEVELQVDAGKSYAGTHPLISRWLELSDTLGREIIFGVDVVTSPQYRATAAGITSNGGLRLILEDGSDIVEYSGEIRYLDEYA